MPRPGSTSKVGNGGETEVKILTAAPIARRRRSAGLGTGENVDGSVVVGVVGSELLVGGLACLQVGQHTLGLVEGAADPGASAAAGQLVALAPSFRQPLGHIGWAGSKKVLQLLALEPGLLLRWWRG